MNEPEKIAWFIMKNFQGTTMDSYACEELYCQVKKNIEEDRQRMMEKLVKPLRCANGGRKTFRISGITCGGIGESGKGLKNQNTKGKRSWG